MADHGSRVHPTIYSTPSIADQTASYSSGSSSPDASPGRIGRNTRQAHSTSTPSPIDGIENTHHFLGGYRLRDRKQIFGVLAFGQFEGMRYSMDVSPRVLPLSNRCELLTMLEKSWRLPDLVEESPQPAVTRTLTKCPSLASVHVKLTFILCANRIRTHVGFTTQRNQLYYSTVSS